MDTQEAGRLAERFASAVYRLAYARTGRTADAEDVMQDVFLRLLTKAPHFADDEHAKAWLLRVTANRANDLRRSSWGRRLPLEAAEGIPAPEAERGEALEAVVALPPKLRSVVHLFYYEELSVAEIAKVLRLSQGSVKTRLSRARKLLREQISERGDERVSG